MAKRYHHSKRAKHHMEALEHEMHPKEHKKEHYKPSAHKMPHHSPVPNVVSEMPAHGSKHGRYDYMGHMISEDHSAPALLPREVIDREWPVAYKGDVMAGKINDLFSGVQAQLDEDEADMARELGPKKY